MGLQGKPVLTPSTKMQGCGAGLQQQHSSGEEPNLASEFLSASPLDTAAALGFVSEEGELLPWTSCDLSQVAKWGCNSSPAGKVLGSAEILTPKSIMCGCTLTGLGTAQVGAATGHL